MPLTPEQEAQLAELQAEQSRPEPRTDSGLAGILHTLLDIVSGAVPHLAADVWAGLHHEVENVAGDKQAADEQPAADDESQAARRPSPSSSSGGSSSTSSGKSSGKK
jgi:outer membrane murein-binding lipoprotein Lpp